MERMLGADRPKEKNLRRAYRRLVAHQPFRRILRRLGVDPSGSWWRGSEDVIYRALGTCLTCSHAGACRSWLEQDHPGESYPCFCPNGAVVELCRAMARDADRRLS